ncbi:MAG TPA: alpha/beta hydrolase family protein [Acidimicrobiia bacterium]
MSELAEEVEALLRANGVPSRRAEPRLARRLASAEQRLVPFGEGNVAAWRCGTGRAVLLVHGWQDDNSLWEPLIDALVERDQSVVAFDMPAHGFSDGEWGLHPQAGDAVLAVAAALGPIDAVVGHSSGAAVAGLAIREGLTADRAVLIAPPLRGDNRWLRVADRLGYSQDVAIAAQTIYEERIGRARADFDLRSELPRVNVDLMVIHSVDDERMPFSDSQEVVRQCSGAELLAVTGLTHRRTARDVEVVVRTADYLTQRRDRGGSSQDCSC